MSFTRMDRGKIEDWKAIGQAVAERQAGMPQMIIAMLARLEAQVDGFAVNQLQHGLQTATRAASTRPSLGTRWPVDSRTNGTRLPLTLTTILSHSPTSSQ